MWITPGLRGRSSHSITRCPMAGEVVSEGITVKEGWNRPVAPERLSAAERLELPSKRVQFDPPEIKKISAVRQHGFALLLAAGL